MQERHLLLVGARARLSQDFQRKRALTAARGIAIPSGVSGSRQHDGWPVLTLASETTGGSGALHVSADVAAPANSRRTDRASAATRAMGSVTQVLLGMPRALNVYSASAEGD